MYWALSNFSKAHTKVHFHDSVDLTLLWFQICMLVNILRHGQAGINEGILSDNTQYLLLDDCSIVVGFSTFLFQLFEYSRIGRSLFYKDINSSCWDPVGLSYLSLKFLIYQNFVCNCKGLSSWNLWSLLFVRPLTLNCWFDEITGFYEAASPTFRPLPAL